MADGKAKKNKDNPKAGAAAEPKAGAGKGKAAKAAAPERAGQNEREARRAANQAEREAKKAGRQAERAAKKAEREARQAKDPAGEAAPSTEEKVAKSKPANDKFAGLSPEEKALRQREYAKLRFEEQEAKRKARQNKRRAERASLGPSASAAPVAGFAAPKAAAAPEPASVTVSEQPTRPTRPAAPAVSAAATPAPSAPKAAKAAAPTPEAAPAPVQAPVQVQAQAQAQEQSFNILIVAQNGTLAREAVLFAASLRRNSPNWQGQLIVAEPLPEGAWSGARTRIPDAERALLTGYGAEILPFTARHFGRAYPYGNKIEALALLPAKENFIFFDTDTLILGPLDQIAFNFARPSASMRREGTWPEPPLYGPGYAEIWKSLYDRFQLPFETSLDPTRSEDDWERYLYFNAGWFFGSDPDLFGRRFLDAALKVQADPGEALACQSLDPWLDQATLPLVIHSFLGGRPGPELDGLDGAVTCHYRNLSLLYAREPEAALSEVETLLADPKIAALFAQDAGAQKLVVQGEGRKVLRPLFAGGLPPSEKAMRQVLKRSELWFPQ